MSKLQRADFPRMAKELMSNASALADYLKAELPRVVEVINGERPLPGRVSTLDDYLDSVFGQITGRLEDVMALSDSLRECYGRPPAFLKKAEQGDQ
jgi:hypothetical protein